MFDAPPPLPFLSAATLVRALFKRPSRAAPAESALESAAAATRYRLAAIDGAHVARYRRELGFEGGHLPLTYCYLLAQRAHLATMLGAAFPFRLVGVIHVDNQLSAGPGMAMDGPLELETVVRVAPPGPNGAVHAMLDTRATRDGGLVFACSSNYLVVRGRRTGPRAAASEPVAAPDAPALAAIAEWRLTPASGREYAALSGDWNPIHLWPWTARLMGLQRPIIHGMHTLGRVCAELERAAGRPLTQLGGRFRAPVELGRSLVLAASLEEGCYTVGAGGRIAVEGQFSFDSAQAMRDA
jgi:acyl dehydratase